MNSGICNERTLWNDGIDYVPFENPMWVCNKSRAKITNALKTDHSKIRFAKFVDGRDKESSTCRVLDYADDEQSFLCESTFLKPYKMYVKDYEELKVLKKRSGGRTRRRHRSKRTTRKYRK